MPFRNVTASVNTYSLTVDYGDSGSLVQAQSVQTGNIQVVGPRGYSQTPELVSKTSETNLASISATYRLNSGFSNSSFNGTYAVVLLKDTVADTQGNKVKQQTIGTFQVNIG